MNARVATLLAGDPAAWAAAGDQLYVDLDLGESNLPAGTRLAIGEAVLEVSAHSASAGPTNPSRAVGSPTSPSTSS